CCLEIGDMAAATLSSNLAAEGIGSWAEAVEQDTQLPTETDRDGLKTVVDYVYEDDGKYKVVTQYKTITKKVPRIVADRKKWKKFGVCKGESSGPQIATTYVAEEVEIQFVRNRAGEQILDVQEDKQQVKATSREHCRYCKANDHWSTNCPYKEMYMVDEEPDPAVVAAQEKERSGRYVAPSLRPDARGGQMDNRRSEENTCRVTNLPQDCDEGELRDLFAKIGRVQRVFIARDKHSNMPKGFAFVTYDTRQDAAKAIEVLNNLRMNHMVLKVEWTRPNPN
ncbi:hypothetical protein PMAYCL1PPCAC_06995, partial [Pristionchus mayeri]